MFNGITMKILGLHSVSFDQPIESRKAEETYENSENEQLKKIRTEINELNDGENTANDKIEIQWTLNKEFAEFLRNKPEIAKQLWDAVNLISAEEGSDNAKAKADLVAFLKPIINPVDIKQDITDLNEEWWKFYEKNLDKSDGAIDKGKIESTITEIFGIIWEEASDWENENITKYRNTINNIKKVLDNPNETNTKSLQKFILANLDWEAKNAFLEWNFRKDSEGNRNPEDPDWLFGQATLNWVNAFLIKLEEHVNNIKGAEEIMSNNKKPIEPEWWLTWQVKTETPKPREQPIDTTPLDIKDGKYKGLHQVRTDSQIVCQNAELNWATFYSLSVEWQESGEAPNESGFNWLMRLSNSPDEIFRVKIDKDWYLCPVIENCNSGKRILVKNNPSCISYLQKKIPDGLPWNPIIVWNSKLEDYAIRSDATNYREGLTIEPMEIDWHGVSPDLSELLVMMNFVNYLRFNKKIDNIDFDNNDPDLRLNDQGKLEVRVDRKSNRTYDEKWNVVKNGRWYEVPDRFWLSEIKPERIKNLIKFNNGEDWRDKWDKKKGNKYYDKMTLPKAEIQTVNPTAPVAPVEQSDVESDATINS